VHTYVRDKYFSGCKWVGTYQHTYTLVISLYTPIFLSPFLFFDDDLSSRKNQNALLLPLPLVSISSSSITPT